MNARQLVLLFLPLLLLLAGVTARAVTLEQVVSHENPNFHANGARLTVGKDGMVYVANGGNPSGYVLRLSRDGTGKVGTLIPYCANNVTANVNGVLAVSAAHFTHSILFYDKHFKQYVTASDFQFGDAYGWDAPRFVEAGVSGDFYALDQFRNRVLRLNGAGKVVAVYPVRDAGEANWGSPDELRVCEKHQAFYWLAGGTIRCCGFDGKTRWVIKAGVGGNPWDGYHGSYDVDENGILYIIGQNDQAVSMIGADGKPAGSIALQMGNNAPAPGMDICGLRVFGGDIVIKRNHPAELFQCYSLDGTLKHVVSIDYEKLAVTFPQEVWAAGASMPFRIDFTAANTRTSPNWHVWLCPLGSSNYQDLPLQAAPIDDPQNPRVQVPVDAAGLYRLKVTPETQPLQHGLASEYLVQTVVEIRQPNTQGTASVQTPNNRLYYGRGEEIPASVYFRTAGGLPGQVTVKLLDGQQTVASRNYPVGEKHLELRLLASLTRALRPGAYTLAVEAPGLTCVPQPLLIGPGVKETPFQRVLYADYGTSYPDGDFWTASDAAASHLLHINRLGFNLMVDRLGLGLQGEAIAGTNRFNSDMHELAERVGKDPLGVAPEKASISPAFLQSMAGYSAFGQRQMAILMGNDAGLPIGTGFDGRKPEEFSKDIARVTNGLASYPAFRGWSWASNWWVGKVGADAAASKEQGDAYKAALKLAQDQGKWDPVLEEVSNSWLGFAPTAEKFFNGELGKINQRHLVIATAAPYRNVFSYPPITFSNVDEVDLQIQWEQMAPPYHAPHNVDFYTRPGKPAWGHPEVWNDDGTGGQILPTLFQMVMRGAGGVGQSGLVPNWNPQPDDSRLAYFGMPSIYRSLNRLLADYGPWFTTLKNNDRVAIVASGRMFRLDDWPNVWGRHFARVLEAYVACLHAHYPASIVFTDDLRPGALKQYKAVLLIDQRLEMEPELTSALHEAQAAGVTVLADVSCRPELVPDFTPLDVKFDHFENDPSAAGDDDAYWRFLADVRRDLPALTAALHGVMPPVAEIDNDEVFLSERTAGEGRHLFVVNNTTPQLEPAQLWRATLCVSSRVPLVQPVTLHAEGKAVYDVFAMKQVAPQQGVVNADLRTLPARIYAILPAPIAEVVLRGPKQVTAGQTFSWSVGVHDAQHQALRAGIPIRVRFLGADGNALDTVAAAVLGGEYSGAFTAPLNPPAGALSLEATELLSGKSARLPLNISPVAPPDLESTAESAVVPANASATGNTAGNTAPSAEMLFGPHFRDIAVSSDGAQVLMNAMNWDNNLYALDTNTGALRWEKRLGHYFTFAPQALEHGFAVQGFDFNAPESYHLYRVDADGNAERRFALYGLSRRLPHRFIPGMVNDRMNNFAVPSSGEWVASAGDLGLALWSRDGTLRWTQDWWKTNRSAARLTGTEGWSDARLVTPVIAAPDAQTLLLCQGVVATFLDAATGKPLQQLTLAASGDVRKIVCTPDGRNCALLASTEGGRVFLLRDRQLMQSIPTDADSAALSSDGLRLAVTTGNVLKCYALGGGLLWSFSGDDQLRFPRFDAANLRLVVASNLGSVYVLDRRGAVLLERDMGALAAPAWLPAGDLVLATWMGQVTRVTRANQVVWSVHLQPTLTDMRGKLLTDDAVPTSRVVGWGNADATAAPLTPNLLAQTTATIKFFEKDREVELTQKAELLTDGKPDAPKQPWLRWCDISWLGEGSAFNYLQLDTFRTQLKVTGITLVEDPAHPESWLRDASFEYWDQAKEQWVFVQPLLSNTAIHTHTFAHPVEAARFRIVLPPGLVGNLRLGEIVLHGDVLGCSHPDVLAKRPVAVLFDEQLEDLKCLQGGDNGFSFKFDGACSGTRCLQMLGDHGAGPGYQPPFGETIPNWDFQIAEKPQPGQYRYLQFAWRALSPTTTGISLRVSGSNYGGLNITAGIPKHFEGETVKLVAATPPLEWKVVRVDLWQALPQLTGIRSLCLGAVGGPAAYDQILLGRTEADLPPVK